MQANPKQQLMASRRVKITHHRWLQYSEAVDDFNNNRAVIQQPSSREQAVKACSLNAFAVQLRSCF
jgi:hypothetical protein